MPSAGRFPLFNAVQAENPNFVRPSKPRKDVYCCCSFRVVRLSPYTLTNYACVWLCVWVCVCVLNTRAKKEFPAPIRDCVIYRRPLKIFFHRSTFRSMLAVIAVLSVIRSAIDSPIVCLHSGDYAAIEVKKTTKKTYDIRSSKSTG